MSVNKTLVKWLLVYIALYTAFAIFWAIEGNRYSKMKGDKEFTFLRVSFVLQYAFIIVALIKQRWQKVLYMLFIPPALFLVSLISSLGLTGLITKHTYDREVFIAYTILNGAFFSFVWLRTL